MKIIVIGGGASGMAAAIAAARKGADVTIIEKEARLGRKLLATGNGRCNFSNRDFGGNEYNEDAEEFTAEVLKRVTPEYTLEFFNELGVYPREESEGRIYPASGQAASVLDALRFEVERYKNIEVFYGHWIKGIVPQKKGGYAVVSHKNLRFMTDKIILACGGSAGSQYGSEGDGFPLSESLGHTVKEPCPALIKLNCEESFFKQLKGIRAKGKVSLYGADKKGENEKLLCDDTGEIQFTETGISGICVFNISGRANRHMQSGGTCGVEMDLFPEIEEDEFRSMMAKRLENSRHKACEEFLNGLINKKLIPVVLKECGVSKLTEKAEKITPEQLEKISAMLKSWRVKAVRSKKWGDAQTTSGGVLLSEISPETMESVIRPGLYFAGEVTDVDGRCGGYNLQWAWSSGILAGSSAAEGGEEKGEAEADA